MEAKLDFPKHMVLGMDMKRLKMDADSILKRIELFGDNNYSLTVCGNQLSSAIENLTKVLEKRLYDEFPNKAKPTIYK